MIHPFNLFKLKKFISVLNFDFFCTSPNFIYYKNGMDYIEIVKIGKEIIFRFILIFKVYFIKLINIFFILKKKKKTKK